MGEYPMRVINIPEVATQVTRAACSAVAPCSWDIMLRSCGLVALAALTVSLLFPAISDLAAFFTLMLVACGPASAFMPAMSEPVLMVFGRLYPALMVAGIGIVAIVLVEFLNFRLFDAVLHSNRLTGFRNAKCTRLVIHWFESQPFLTVAVAAFTPIPFWTARTCAVLSRYSLPRYMCATALGRFWRIFLIAAVGSVLPFTVEQLLLGVAFLIVALGAVMLLRRHRRRPPHHALTVA
jgi:uncharacterized membrane protein YdjX (TVP38/TMEM64 family)